MKRIFVDASVVIPALLSPAGGAGFIFRFIKAGRLQGITSQAVLDELLEADKEEKTKRSRDEMLSFIAESALIIREAPTPEELVPYEGLIDAEDAHLIAGAHLSKCSYLISHDKQHMVRDDVKQRFLPLQIMSPGEFCEELRRELYGIRP